MKRKSQPVLRMPVFVSCPTLLSQRQESSKQIVESIFGEYSLAWHALGVNDYPEKWPLHEVIAMARNCSGGLILGFEQLRCKGGVFHPGCAKKLRKEITSSISLPTPWNHIEAGILFTLGLPILIFREPDIAREPLISGGVFDDGVTDVFIHEMPTSSMNKRGIIAVKAVFRRWLSRVHDHYYGIHRTMVTATGPFDPNR